MSKDVKRIKTCGENADYCECRPVCKHRRRIWKGKVQKTSDELLFERRLQKNPYEVYSKKPNLRASKPDYISDRDPVHLRICEAPIDDDVQTPFLKMADMAKKIGAWDSVKARCAFCSCRGCCVCPDSEYALSDESAAARRREMRGFDQRVKDDYMIMRIMYL